MSPPLPVEERIPTGEVSAPQPSLSTNRPQPAAQRHSPPLVGAVASSRQLTAHALPPPPSGTRAHRHRSRQSQPAVANPQLPASTRLPGHQPSASTASSSSSNISIDDEEDYLDSESRSPLLRSPNEDEDESDGSRHRSRGAAAAEEGCIGPYGEDRAEREHRRPPSTSRYPKERLKTLIALILLFCAGCLNDIVLSYIHDYVPDTDPLPDFVFAHTPYIPWTLRISEYLMLSSFAFLLLLTFFHRHRWIVLRRIATIGALLYFGRCVTMFVTQVPKADENYYCSPKLNPANRTIGEVMLRALRILSGLGLAINGKHTLCGDYIYSGHTIVLVTCYLFIREYSPKRWRILHFLSAIASAIGVFCLLISRGHYTVDVVIAYWITTRIFWTYHTLCGFAVLRDGREHNHLRKEFWYPLFRFMESNVPRPLPHRYGFPFRVRVPRRVRTFFKPNDS